MRLTRFMTAALSLAALPTCLGQSESGLSSATDEMLAKMPGCALKCLLSAIANSPCPATNTTCVCTNKPLTVEMEECVGKTCTVRESLTTKNLTLTNCGSPIRDRSTGHVIMSDTLGTIAGVVVCQRLILKLWWKMGWGTDDWFILTAFLSGVPSLAVNQWGVTANGLGRDVWTLPFAKINRFGMYFYIMAILYFLQITLLKMALLFFYLRIFPAQNVRRALWATVAFNAAFGIAFVLMAVFQCRPINYFWTKWDGEHKGMCYDINAITWSNAAISIFLDVWMISVPLAAIRSLKLDWKKKIGVGMMFVVGTFVTVVSIIRLQYLVQFGKSSNLTYDYLDVNRWSIIEISVGEICACMPSLRMVLVRVFPRLGGSSQRDYGKYPYGSNGGGGSNGGRGRARSLGYIHQNHSRSGNHTAGSRVGKGGSNGGRAIALGSHAISSKAEPRGGDMGAGGITYERSYMVEYGDTDETQLVSMKPVDSKSERSWDSAYKDRF